MQKRQLNDILITKFDDLQCYKKAIEEYNKNRKTYTLEEVKEELDL